MGRTCSTRGGDAEIHRNFWLKNLKGRHHSVGLGIDGSIVLEWILGK